MEQREHVVLEHRRQAARDSGPGSVYDRGVQDAQAKSGGWLHLPQRAALRVRGEARRDRGSERGEERLNLHPFGLFVSK